MHLSEFGKIAAAEYLSKFPFVIVEVLFKPLTDEEVFYDKFLCDKFYLLVCTRNFDIFFYDKCTVLKS